MWRSSLFCASILVLVASGNVRADDRSVERLRFLASRLNEPLAEIEKGEVGLMLLLQTIEALASPAEAEQDPAKKRVQIVLSDAFNRLDDGPLDPERKQIRIPTRLVGVSSGAHLRLICEQLDAGYVVRPDYIEIVPIEALRKELNYPNGRADDLRSLVIGFYDKVPLHTALKDLGERYSRTVVLSPLAEKELEKPISARLLNVPFETAVETLVDMADLKLVRKANVFFVTTKEQATTLNAEYEKRMKAERDKLRK
jgi:hypothetical protein